MITDLPTKRTCALLYSDKHFSEFFTYKMAAKINWHRHMEQNYVTVTLSIGLCYCSCVIDHKLAIEMD